VERTKRIRWPPEWPDPSPGHRTRPALVEQEDAEHEFRRQKRPATMQDDYQKVLRALSDKKLNEAVRKKMRNQELKQAEEYRQKHGRNPPIVLFPSND